MSFGYNASVLGSTRDSGINENATLLLERLYNKRVNLVSLDRDFDCAELTWLQNPPIIFICHSLGGLVVKKVRSPDI